MLRRFIFLAFVVMLVSAPLAFWHASSAQHEVMPGTARRSIYAAYDTLGRQWQTTLLLNNTTRTPIVVVPTVYSPEGAGIRLSAVSLEPHEHKRLDFAQWIAPLGRDYVRGSLRLQFESVPFGLGAILSSVNAEKGQVVEAILHSALELKSSRLEAIWSAPSPAGRITVSVLNITDYSLNASLRVTSRDGSVLRDEVLPLAPHQARFLDLRGMTREQERVGGISIEHGGLRGAVFAQGFVLEPSGGLAYSIPFTDPATLGDAKFSGAGILLGKHSGYGQEDMTFEGRLLVRNVSQAPLAAEPVLQRGQARLSLGNFSLEAGEAVEIPVPATAVPPGEGAIGIEIPHSGSAEDLIAQWFSIESSGMVVETPLRSVGPKEHVGGSNPFLLAGDFRSVTYIKNTGDGQARVVAWIEHAAGQYMLGLQDVPAGETLAIDIAERRDEQTPDVQGEKLPPDLAQGNINWRWYDGPPIVGRTNVMSHKQSISSNRSCSTCLCSPTDVWLEISPSAIQGFAGDSVPVKVTQWERGCDGFSRPVALLGPGDFTWSTTNPFIALPSGLSVSLGSAGTAIVQAQRNNQQVSQFVQTGEFTADGEPVGECQPQTVPASGSAIVNVTCATPTNFRQQSVFSSADGALEFTYTWSSSTGNQSHLQACTLGETVFYPNYPSTPYNWPLPMVASTLNPTELTGSGSNQILIDQNKPPDRYQEPYSAASFNATQRFWWSCPCYQNGAVQSFVPDITIRREIFKDSDNFWKYRITKSGSTNTVRLPNQ